MACGSEVSIYVVCDSWGDVSMYGRVTLWEGRQGLRKKGLRGGSGGLGSRKGKREAPAYKAIQRNPHRTFRWSDRKLSSFPCSFL